MASIFRSNHNLNIQWSLIYSEKKNIIILMYMDIDFQPRYEIINLTYCCWLPNVHNIITMLQRQFSEDILRYSVGWM